ncbi:unnamed protein product [Cuscuta epithymum]|uniref:BZIP domain-containing protein n=1 Tax=Cuscuta epithymum TaxID=186058 RepID=A0AAV0BZ43_9ASTE|nr:unnamed protein product [Cuscuta epithymum]
MKEQNFTATMENGFLEKPFDNQEESVSQDELMIRRLKNRERQRRYRARKRLQTDIDKTPESDSRQYTPHRTLPIPVTPPEFAAALDTKEFPFKMKHKDVKDLPADHCSPTVLLEVPVQVVTPGYQTPNNAISWERPRLIKAFQEPVTRTYCARDWKKDARKSQELKQQNVRHDAATNMPKAHKNELDEVTSCRSALDISPAQANCESIKFTSSRRHWKAEARNKKV